MSGSWTPSSYRAGDWFGVFGEHATVVLPASEKARAGRIWALVDEGAGFDEVLDALIADGLRELPGFVLVSESEDETKVVIRGPARAEFVVGGETVTVEGSSVTTWAERSLRGVDAMRVEVADAEGAPDLVIREGLVRVARVDRPAYAAPSVVETDDVTPGSDDVTPESVPVVDAEETAFYAVPPAPTDAGPPEAGNWHVGDLARRVFGTADEPPSPEPAGAAVARLTFSGGEVVEVDRVVLVGRAPVPRDPDAAEEPRLVTVTSPQQEISSTHVEIRPGVGPDAGRAVLTDLGSTNGTVLELPGLEPEDLRPWVAVHLTPGAVVDLGDGVTIRVDDV